MWLKRTDYEALRERALKAEIQLQALTEVAWGHQKSYEARIDLLEAALLKANDEAHTVRKEVSNRPAVPVNLAALFDDEDPELVEADRRRAKDEGSTDGLLAAMDE